MGYEDDSNKRYQVFGPSGDPLDGVLIKDANDNVVARLDKDGIKDANDEPIVNSNGNGPKSEQQTVDGDGTTTVTVPHNLGVAPTHVQVTPESGDANGDFHVSDKTSSNIELTYSSAVTDSTDNLSYSLYLVP